MTLPSFQFVAVPAEQWDEIMTILRELRVYMAQPAALVTAEQQDYYTADEAAQYLRVSTSEIYRAVADGQITRTPIGRGREYRIHRDALAAYALAQQAKAGAA